MAARKYPQSRSRSGRWKKSASGKQSAAGRSHKKVAKPPFSKAAFKQFYTEYAKRKGGVDEEE